MLALSFTYAISSHIGWDQTIRQTFANNPRMADLPADQREQVSRPQRQIRFHRRMGWSRSRRRRFFTLVIAGILTGIFNGLLGTELKFMQMFAISAYAFLVRGLYSLLLILLLYLKPPEDFNIQVSPFSPAAYMNRTENPKWLMSLAGSLDLFTIWTIVLLAIGFSVAAKKLSFSKALTGIAIPWLIWVIALMSLQSFQ